MRIELEKLLAYGGGGDASGPTGTPLDAVLGPVAGAVEGGGGGGASFPATGTPLDDVTAMLDPSALPISSTGTPLDSVTGMLPTDSLPI